MSNDSKNSVVFICHESSRTGAPILLLHLLQWLKNNTDLVFQVLIVKGGELDIEFRKIAPTLVLNPRRIENPLRRFSGKILNGMKWKKKIRQFIPSRPALIYSNTFANGKTAAYLKKLWKTSSVTHVHELEGVISSLGVENTSLVTENTDFYLAASGAVKNNLVHNLNIPGNKVEVIYEFLTPVTNHSEIHPGLSEVIRRNGKKFIVGSVGFVDYRKGFDLFLETAKSIREKNRIDGILFVWVGDFGKGKKETVDKFIESNALQEDVYFTGEIKNPWSYYNLFDLFFLASREDPFPLVMLESAWFGKPVLCFDHCGGAGEFIDENCGIILEETDPGKAALEIINGMENKERLRVFGENARNKVKEKFLVDHIAPQIYNKIKSMSGVR